MAKPLVSADVSVSVKFASASRLIGDWAPAGVAGATTRRFTKPVGPAKKELLALNKISEHMCRNEIADTSRAVMS